MGRPVTPDSPTWNSPRRPASPMRLKASREASEAGSNRRSGVRSPIMSSFQDPRPT
jgi:hypothetical protein